MAKGSVKGRGIVGFTPQCVGGLYLREFPALSMSVLFPRLFDFPRESILLFYLDDVNLAKEG